MIAIIQARMGSARLPGKVMLPLAGKPVLEHIIDRTRASKVEKVVVATPNTPDNQPIWDLCQQLQIDVFRGNRILFISETIWKNDVLDRYYQAAKYFKANSIVRITADDPLKDPHVINKVIDAFNGGYASNTIEPTYPLGLDVEMFSFDVLERTWQEAALHYDREHVTPYIRSHPEKFSLVSVKHDQNLSHLRWTLDYPEDYEFIKSVYDRGLFYMEDILKEVYHASPTDGR